MAKKIIMTRKLVEEWMKIRKSVTIIYMISYADTDKVHNEIQTR